MGGKVPAYDGKLPLYDGQQIASVMRGVGDVVKHHERGGEVTTSCVGGEQSVCDYRGGAMEQPPAEHGGRRACPAGVAREWTVTEVGGGCVLGGCEVVAVSRPWEGW